MKRLSTRFRAALVWVEGGVIPGRACELSRAGPGWAGLGRALPHAGVRPNVREGASPLAAPPPPLGSSRFLTHIWRRNVSYLRTGRHNRVVTLPTLLRHLDMAGAGRRQAALYNIRRSEKPIYACLRISASLASFIDLESFLVSGGLSVTWKFSSQQRCDLTGGIRLRQKPQAPTPQTPKFVTAKW